MAPLMDRSKDWTSAKAAFPNGLCPGTSLETPPVPISGRAGGRMGPDIAHLPARRTTRVPALSPASIRARAMLRAEMRKAADSEAVRQSEQT